jgi:hypothetical protein
MMATMPKRCWQQRQRNNDASTATTVGRHAPCQRNACQRDVGDDASGDFSKDGEFVEDNEFSTKGDLAEDGSLAKEGNFNAVGNFAKGRQQCPSNVGKGASATTAPELLQRKDVLRAVHTIPRRLRPQLKQQRHCNACQRDAGNDASGNFAKEGNFVKDDNFGTKRQFGRGRQRSQVGQL